MLLETRNAAMVVVFGSANAFGRDINETELMLLVGTVFVVSVLVVLVYKLARGWEDHGCKAVLPLHHPTGGARRATTKWIKSRKQHYGKLGTILEDQEFALAMSMKRM